MTSHLHCSEQFRKAQLVKQIPYSTDKPWMRQQAGVHQYSTGFIIIVASIGALACSGIFFACAAI